MFVGAAASAGAGSAGTLGGGGGEGTVTQRTWEEQDQRGPEVGAGETVARGGNREELATGCPREGEHYHQSCLALLEGILQAPWQPASGGGGSEAAGRGGVAASPGGGHGEGGRRGGEMVMFCRRAR